MTRPSSAAAAAAITPDQFDGIALAVGKMDEHLGMVEGVAQILVDLWAYEGEIPKIALHPLAHCLMDAHRQLSGLREGAEEIISALEGRP